MTAPETPDLTRAYRSDIDGLRAVAVAAVVAFHAFPGSTPGGFVGVDVFYVVSGFLISGLIFRGLDEGGFSFIDFYARRVRRLLPALALVLSATLAVGWLALLPDEYRQLGRHAAAAAAFVVNLVFIGEAGYFDVAAGLKPLLHLWSLSVEEQFYLVWPLLLVAAGRRRLAIILLVLIGSFALNVADSESNPVAAFFSLQTRLWELASGAMLAFSTRYGGKADLLSGSRRRDLTAAFGLLLVAAATFSPIDQRSFPGWWALCPTLGALLVIAAGPHAWPNRRVLSHPIVVWIGLISYPLYLWHWPIFSFLRIVEGKEPDSPTMLAAIAVAVMLAGLTYQLVERPIRSQWRPRAAAIPLLLALVLAGSAGLLVTRGKGLPQRVANLENIEQFEWAQLRDSYPGRPDDDNMSLDCKSRWFANTDVDYCRQTWLDRAPDIALIGDSHANMYFPGLSAVFARTSVNLLNAGKGGCVPHFDLEGQAFEPQEAGLERACPPVVNAILDRVLATSSIYTVILSSRDPFYKLPAEENERDLRNIWAPAGSQDDSFMAKYARTLRYTLHRLQSAGKGVVLFLDIPLLDFNPKTCVRGPLLRLLGGTPRAPCAVPRKTFASKAATYRRVVSSVLRDFPSIPVFDVANFLCDSAYCWAVKDGRMLYRDDNHLSVRGSTYVGEHLVSEALD